MNAGEVFQDFVGSPVDGFKEDFRSPAYVATARRRHRTIRNMVKTLRLKTILILLLIASAFVYGLAVGTYKVFPFEQIRMVKISLKLNSNHSTYMASKKPRTTQFEYFAPRRNIVMIGDSITQFGLWNEMFPMASIAKGASKAILRRMSWNVWIQY